MDKLIDTIQATEEIDLLLYEAQDPTDGCYISIKHKPIPRGMPGEVFVAPANVPDLLQALANAALQLTSRGHYVAGYSDGSKDGRTDMLNAIDKFDKQEIEPVN